MNVWAFVRISSASFASRATRRRRSRERASERTEESCEIHSENKSIAEGWKKRTGGTRSLIMPHGEKFAEDLARLLSFFASHAFELDMAPNEFSFSSYFPTHCIDTYTCLQRKFCYLYEASLLPSCLSKSGKRKQFSNRLFVLSCSRYCLSVAC